MEQTKRILLICRDKNLNEIIYFCLEGWGYEVCILADEVIFLEQIKKTEPDLLIVDFPHPYKERLNFCQQIKNDFITKSIPVVVLIDRRQLRKHLLSLEHGIDDYLLKPPDPLDLRVRVEMAMRRTQYSFYTNSLTNLPGGRIIEEILKEKISKKEKFSSAHIDIDNFKYFNDRYGYLKGDRAITQTAYILHQTVQRFGTNKDFIGHIGGDDFVFITSLDEEEAVASEFIRQFDRLIPLHYSKEDRVRGYINIEDRLGAERKIPLMSVSVAIVNNRGADFSNTVQINEALASLKSYLKKMPGSNFMVDRRLADKGINKRSEAQTFLKACRRKVCRGKNTKPLGQILLDKGILNSDTLEKNLDIHFRRGLPLGEVLKDSGVIDGRELAAVLSWQQRS
ncbi:MAG: diguanylate cyclase [Candidatus Omnitrophica bacterium]|nr:diguanylate cyclase [Candidatus Omnitrophota bacterium]